MSIRMLYIQTGMGLQHFKSVVTKRYLTFLLILETVVWTDMTEDLTLVALVYSQGSLLIITQILTVSSDLLIFQVKMSKILKPGWRA